jgi:hypothetical protein
MAKLLRRRQLQTRGSRVAIIRLHYNAFTSCHMRLRNAAIATSAATLFALGIAGSGGIRAAIQHAVSASFQGFNGTDGWTKTTRGQRQMNSVELARIKQQADLYKEIRLKSSIPK